MDVTTACVEGPALKEGGASSRDRRDGGTGGCRGGRLDCLVVKNVGSSCSRALVKWKVRGDSGARRWARMEVLPSGCGVPGVLMV